MPDSKMTYFVQVGRVPEPDEVEMYTNQMHELYYYSPTSEYDAEAELIWEREGPVTDSFFEAEARAIIKNKTYRNVRVVSNAIAVMQVIGG